MKKPVTANPVVSVIIPFYDTPRPFLEEAVESVYSQTDSRWELLLVDDGSAPTISNFARQLASKDGRVNYHEHDEHANRGAGASRNLGIRFARGQYIAFLDADDVWLASKLKQQLALLEANTSAGMLYGSSQHWRAWRQEPGSQNKDYVPDLYQAANRIYEPPELLMKFLRGNAPIPHMSSIIIRRNVIKEVGGFLDDFKMVYEDQILIARICLATPVFVSDQVWDRYRLWDQSSYSTALRTGEDGEARLAYLKWLSDYIYRHAPNDRKLEQAINEAISVARSTSSLSPSKLRQWLRRMARKARLRMSRAHR